MDYFVKRKMKKNQMFSLSQTGDTLVDDLVNSETSGSVPTSQSLLLVQPRVKGTEPFKNTNLGWQNVLF